MKNIFSKTFGGLTASYYIREFLFGLIFVALFGMRIYKVSVLTTEDIYLIIFLAVSAFLYPYARFVYHSIIGFFLGDNVFFVNAIFMLVVKFIMMSFCFVFAIIIAPIGLIYLYYYHTKEEKKYLKEQESLQDIEEK